MKHEQMREYTRQAIMEAFWTLYREKPIERISVKEITELAGYNRSTFYEYFTDTYSVLEAIEEELLDYARECTSFIAAQDALLAPDSEHLRRFSEQIEYSTENVGILLGIL